MIIRYKDKSFVAMPVLARLVGKFIFAKNEMTQDEFKMLDKGLNEWLSAVNLDEDEKYEAKYLANLIIEDQKGKYDVRKAVIKEHKLDWRKCLRFPEAYVAEDFIRGQKVLDQWNRDNPELAGSN